MKATAEIYVCVVQSRVWTHLTETDETLKIAQLLKFDDGCSPVGQSRSPIAQVLV